MDRVYRLHPYGPDCLIRTSTRTSVWTSGRFRHERCGTQYANDNRYGSAAITGFGFDYVGFRSHVKRPSGGTSGATLSDQLHKTARRARVPLGLRGPAAGTDPPAAGTANPRGCRHLQRGADVQPRPLRRPSAGRREFLRGGLAGTVSSYAKSIPVLRDEDARMAACLVFPRPLAGDPRLTMNLGLRL